MYIFGTMISKLKGSPKTITFTEGTDSRILEVIPRLLASNFLKPIPVGNLAVIEAAMGNAGYNICGAQIVDPENFGRFDEMIEIFCEIRKSEGMISEQAKKILPGASYFGTMLIKVGIGNCLLGGATYSTANAIRLALQITKTKPGDKIVPPCLILVRSSAAGGNELFAMANCTINTKPTEDELVEICSKTVSCVKIFGIDSKIAFLNYSTVDSSSGEDVGKIRNAYVRAEAAFPDEVVDDEMQFDAAASPTAARTRIKDSKVAGCANTFIFPDINAGNIGYKVAQRLGNFDVYGPVLSGLSAPINDLSRGCSALEVYSMTIVTAVLV